MSEVSYPLEGTDSSVGDKAWEKSSKDWAVGLEGMGQAVCGSHNSSCWFSAMCCLDNPGACFSGSLCCGSRLLEAKSDAYCFPL